MSNLDLLRRLPTEVLVAERAKAEAARDHRFAGELNVALRQRNYIEGVPDPYCPGLVRHVTRDDGGRKITRFEGDISAWLGQHQADGVRVKLDHSLVQAAARAE